MQPDLEQNNTRTRRLKIVWSNPPFSLRIKTNMAKNLIQLIDTHFPPANNFIKPLIVTSFKSVPAVHKICHKL